MYTDGTGVSYCLRGIVVPQSTIPVRPSPCRRSVQLLGVTREAAAEDKDRNGAWPWDGQPKGVHGHGGAPIAGWFMNGWTIIHFMKKSKHDGPLLYECP